MSDTETRPVDELVKTVIREQRYPWVEAIGTRAGRGSGRLSWPAFAQVHARILRGEIALLRVRVPGATGAYADVERESNQAALSALPVTFKAQVHMTQAASPDGDGTFTWSAPLTMTQFQQGSHALNTEVPARSNECALEIGDTDPRVTLAHLAIDGAVARWPYRSRHLWLLVDLTYMAGQEADALTAPAPPECVLTLQSSEEHVEELQDYLLAARTTGQDPMALLAEVTERLRLQLTMERVAVNY